jgi:hypothetical protein
MQDKQIPIDYLLAEAQRLADQSAKKLKSVKRKAGSVISEIRKSKGYSQREVMKYLIMADIAPFALPNIERQYSGCTHSTETILKVYEIVLSLEPKSID